MRGLRSGLRALLAKPAPARNPDPSAAEPGFTDDQKAGGAYWDGIAASAGSVLPRTAWWNDPPTLRHINRIVCGERLDECHAGFHRHRRLNALLRGLGIAAPRAISVGSGNGGKEMGLLSAGIVGSFDCFEAGAGAVDQGRKLAALMGLTDQLRLHHANAFTTDVPGDYDLVYWNNALHHMPDSAAAVTWSRERLRPGGVFAMDDYVGASRFQHSPGLMIWTNRMLSLLPDRLLRDDRDPARLVPRALSLIDVAALIAIDPTEAVDSFPILPAVSAVFPGAEIIPTGGALYFVGLNNAFHNFRSDEDLRLLDALLLADEAVGLLGETQYAVALAVK